LSKIDGESRKEKFSILEKERSCRYFVAKETLIISKEYFFIKKRK
jgi:hypothetical protein